MDNPFEIILQRLDRIETLIKTLQPKEVVQPKEKLPIKIGDACKLIGLSKSRIYVLCKKREIPHFKKGNRLYFYEDELIKWVESGKQLTMNEIDNAADNSLRL